MNPAVLSYTNMIRTIALLLGVVWAGLLAADPLSQSLATQARSNLDAAQAQQRIDALDDDSRALLAEYQHLQQRIALLGADNRRLQARVDGQQRRIGVLQTDLNEVQRLRRELPALNREMAEVLAEFVAADLPFLRGPNGERDQRLHQLEQAQANPELSDGELFRRLLEAWDIELEYGRTLEAWRGDILVAGESRTVELFRLGRAGLYYLSLDHSHGGVWSVADQQWQAVAPATVVQLRAALEIAGESAAPQFLVLPLAAPIEAGESGDAGSARADDGEARS